MNRREFGKLIFKGTLVSIIAPNVLSRVLVTAQPPALTTLGKELTKGKLLSSGWHKVVIENVFESTSKRDGSMLVHIVMKPLDEDAMSVSQVVSERFPSPILSTLEKANINIEGDSVDLNDLIGKEINVEIQQIKYANREFSSVRG